MSLPAGVFKPYTGVKTAVLVFRKPQGDPPNPPSKGDQSRPTDKVWFYEVKNDGYNPDKIVGGGRPETPEQNDIPDLLDQWRTYKTSGFKSPPGIEGGTLLEPGSEEPRCWWASLDTLIANDFNLAAGRYKPQIAEPIPDEDPAELIQEVLAIEADITAGLKKLLVEVKSVE